MRLLQTILCVVFSLSLAGLAQAQTYPQRPIRVVVPWPPGGAVDLLARPIAQRLAQELGQPVIVENRPGANSIIGSQAVAMAKPDGYTLLIDNITGHAINATLYKSLSFNSERDFAPVGLIASVSNALVVAASAPVSSVQDIIALARSKPGQLAFASFGVGSTAHLLGEWFKLKTGVNMLHVPYKGGPPALAGLMAGQVFMMFATTPSVSALLKGGRLKVIATTSARRSPDAPNLPAVAETIPDFVAYTLYGAMFPAHTPVDIVQKVSASIRKIVSEPDIASMLGGMGFTVQSSSPEELGKILKRDTARWGEIVKLSGAEAQ
jgi:tripartite-type tricarboxylate transporter receptor subunit TctC